jgi:hypothetical protein
MEKSCVNHRNLYKREVEGRGERNKEEINTDRKLRKTEGKSYSNT